MLVPPPPCPAALTWFQAGALACPVPKPDWGVPDEDATLEPPPPVVPPPPAPAPTADSLLGSEISTNSHFCSGHWKCQCLSCHGTFAFLHLMHSEAGGVSALSHFPALVLNQ